MTGGLRATLRLGETTTLPILSGTRRVRGCVVRTSHDHLKGRGLRHRWAGH